MKRLPLVVSFVLFIVLCASAAYWAMQLFKPPARPVAAPPRVAQAEVKPEAAAALFGGGRSNVAVASNYQLRGVVVSGNGRESVAILSADGKPAQAVRIETEVLPGVTVKEVHRDYVLLSEGGVTKRVELPESAKDQVDVATVSPVQTARPPSTRPPPVTPPPPPAPTVTPQMAQPGMTTGGMPPPGTTMGTLPPPGAPPGMAAEGAPVPPPAVNQRMMQGAMPPGANPGMPPNVVNPPPSQEPPPPAMAAPGSPPLPPNNTSGR